MIYLFPILVRSVIVPIDIEKYNSDFDGSPRVDDYIVAINYLSSPPRSFVGLLSSVTWEFERRPCMYAGNSQAGPIGNVDTPNDSVIEGDYTQYDVDSMLPLNV